MEKKFRNSAIDLTDLAIGLLILGVVVAIGARMLLILRNNRISEIDSFDTQNESVNMLTSTNSLANQYVTSLDVVSPENATTKLVSGTDYTLVVDTIDGGATITNLTAATDIWNVSYTCANKSSPEYLLPNAAAAGLGEYGNWFDIIVIVGIAGLILSLIFMAFGRKGGETGVAY